MRLFITLLVLISAGCKQHAKTPPDTLVVGLSSAPATLDPRFATDAVGSRISSLIFNSLIRLGPNLEALPDAAESWKLNGSIYTFYLRRDLRFHNGRPLNIDDVKFSMDQINSPGSPFASMRDMAEKVEVREENGQIVIAIRVHGYPEKFLKSELQGLKLIPKQEVLQAGAQFSRHPIGTGPYRFVSADLNDIVLEGVHTATKYLDFKVIHDDFTRYQKLMKGELDICQGEISMDRIEDFKKRPEEFQVTSYPTLNTTYILVNFRDPILKQLKVREALARSINRAELIKYKQHGMAEEATTILAPTVPYHDNTLKNLPYSPDVARELIKGAGLIGRPLVLKTSNVPSAIDDGRVLSNQMSQTGLKVDVQSYEWSTFYTDVKHGNFQLATMTWVGILDPHIYVDVFHSREKPPGRNRGSYSNPALDALLDKSNEAKDFAGRKKIFDEVQEIVHNDIAIIPLWYEQRSAIARRNISHYVPNQVGDYRPLVEAKKEP